MSISQFQSQFLKTLHERGFIHSQTDAQELDLQCKNNAIVGYIGFDATASSLHVGSLVQIMMLKHLQLCGHTPIILMGGGTTKVGDPSGKDESRKILNETMISQNIRGIQSIFKQFLNFDDGDNKAIIVNNDDWLSQLNYIEFLRDYGKHFSVNRMLSFDSVKLRLEREQPLSFLEFNYMILQGYDFVELKKRYNCILQMGGSDQWGNIVNGIELARKVNGNQLFGLTTPLLTTSTGAKMGKTADGAIWLNAELLNDYDYWQFWRNTCDSDVIKFLKLFTLLPLAEIDKLAKLQGAELNEVKKILATEATKLARGEEAAQIAAETAKNAFVMGGTEGLPETLIAQSEFNTGYNILDLLVFLGLALTKSEARRLIKGGGVKVNNLTINDDTVKIILNDFDNEILKLSIGKKKHHLVKIK
jgi:tyrosyl-tRNA synthetase